MSDLPKRAGCMFQSGKPYPKGPRRTAMLLVALQAMGLQPITFLCTFIGAASLAGGGVARYLVAPVVSLLKDVPSYLPAPQPECYRRRQRHCPEHDQERAEEDTEEAFTARTITVDLVGF